MSDTKLVHMFEINGRKYDAVNYKEATNILGRKQRCLDNYIAAGMFPYHAVEGKGYLRKLDVEKLAKKLDSES